LAVERREKSATFFECAQAVEPYGVEPFKDVVVLSMLRRMPVIIDKSLDLFKSSDDALVSRAPTPRLLGLRKFGKLASQLVKIEVTHSGPHL
jgi:hypothetical protein